MEGPYTILPDAEPVSSQDQVSAGILGGFDGIHHPQRVLIKSCDPLDAVADWAAQGAGRTLGHSPIWLRLHRMDQSRGLLVVLHSPTPEGEADLIAVGHRGMLTRSALRCLSGWAFGVARLRRVVARIPVNRPDLQDLVRRCGFRHEGTARAYYPNDTDASVWGMHRSDCPWLSRPAPAIPAVNTSPSSTQRVH